MLHVDRPLSTSTKAPTPTLVDLRTGQPGRHHPPRRHRPSRTDRRMDERRYMGLEVLTKARLSIIAGDVDITDPTPAAIAA